MGLLSKEDAAARANPFGWWSGSPQPQDPALEALYAKAIPGYGNTRAGTPVQMPASMYPRQAAPPIALPGPVQHPPRAPLNQRPAQPVGRQGGPEWNTPAGGPQAPGGQPQGTSPQGLPVRGVLPAARKPIAALGSAGAMPRPVSGGMAGGQVYGGGNSAAVMPQLPNQRSLLTQIGRQAPIQAQSPQKVLSQYGYNPMASGQRAPQLPAFLR